MPTLSTHPLAFVAVGVATLSCNPAADKTSNARHPASSLQAIPPIVIDTSWRVDFAQAGPLRIGMTRQQIAAAVGEPLPIPSEDSSSNCGSVFTPKSVPTGVSLTIVNDTFDRVDVSAGGVLTTRGAQIGLTEGRIKQLYGDSLEEGLSLGGEHELTAYSTDPERRYAITFVTNGEHVTSYRAGRRLAVAVEECQ